MTNVNQKPSRRHFLWQGAATTTCFAAHPMIKLFPSDEPNAASSPLLKTLRPEHPRLIATSSHWERIKKRRGDDVLLDKFLTRSEAEARAIVPVAPMLYKKDGRRLLHVSRVVLRRVLLLSLQYNLTGDVALVRRANEEMLAVAAFTDWNPSHFLDVAEMTAALAFGYDWLYETLDAEARTVIAQAIIEKGLRPGVTENKQWLQSPNNWNQVCLAGLSLGALAIAERDPVLASQILEMTKANNLYGMKPYAPAGVYPEGAMYWGYGTSFEAVLLGALQSALGTDWQLSQIPGFLSSADALYQQLAPSGSFYNFSDGVERPGLEAGMWWFAHTLKKPELLQYDFARLKEYTESTRAPQPSTESDRLLPLAVLWWPNQQTTKTLSRALSWYGRSPNPLGVFRSAWDDPDALYLAIKGGKATLSHGHMDAGSFIFEANGVRWGRDMGMQDYLSLESKGVDLWRNGQNDGRWKVFRLNNFSHSTLTLNNQLHQVNGHAAITHFGDSANTGAILDLSPVFADQARRVNRGVLFHRQSHALIRDEIEGMKPGDTVRWAMLTKAEIVLPEGDAPGAEAILRENGKRLRAQLHASVPARFEEVSAEPPKNDYDAPNPGMRLLVIHLTIPPSGNLDLTVTLQTINNEQQARITDALATVALREWPLPAVA